MSSPFETNILHIVFNVTRNTSSDFLQKLQMSGEVFSPPEPSRAKFTPSGRVFRLSRLLAWTLPDQTTPADLGLHCLPRPDRKLRIIVVNEPCHENTCLLFAQV